MTWPGASEHRDLHDVATSLVGILRDLPVRLRHSDAEHVFHTDSARRCRSLALYIESALATAERNAYAPALGSMRSAMEHVFVDKLVFLGQRYVQIFRGVDDATWTEWQRAQGAGEAWADVTGWSRRGEVVRIFREGIHSQPAEHGSRQTIGVHYFLLNEYSPFVGPPSVQVFFDDGLSKTADREAEARRHRFIHDNYLKWQSIKESLKANGFTNDGMLRRLDVHHRFLSAFVHPNTDVARLLYGKDAWDWPTYDHYSSELILLYAIVFAVEELRNYRSLAERQPTVEVKDWDATAQLCDQAWRLSSHLWFPGQEPHSYDRFQEANRRGFRRRRSGDQTLEDPTALSLEEIGYYVNPLTRLVGLHASTTELITGLSYQSPWHRRDAHLR